MAIRVIWGKPGSGKTYYAVHHLLSVYFSWSEERDRYEPRRDEDDPRKLRVVTNITGLAVGEDLDALMGAAGGPAKFFSWRVQRPMADDARLIYVIDEAQILFPRQFRDADTFTFFQKHRHLGIDVYLITQDVKTLALELRALAEQYVEAVQRTYSVTGEFRYKFLGGPDERTPWKTKVLRRDRRVFSVYRSMLAKETESIRSAPLRILVFALLTLAVALFPVIYVYRSWAAPAEKRNAKVVKTRVSVASERLGPPAPPSLEVAPARPGYERTGEVRVIGVAGDGSVGWIVVTGDGLLESHYRVDDFRRLCRCHPEVLAPGQLVTTWRHDGRNVPRPARVRASAASPGGQPPPARPARPAESTVPPIGVKPG